jgi:hypothetical protein
MALEGALDYEAPEAGWNKGGDGKEQQQCTHRHRRGRRRQKRCRQASSRYDYRWCDEHLDRVQHLRIGLSKIEGAQLGLFATAAFSKGQVIGLFGGELIDNTEYVVLRARTRS